MAAIAFAASPVVGTKLATRNPRVSRRTRAAPTTRAAASTTTKSISQTFVDLKKRNQCAFVPFICAGDPNLDATEKAVRILDDAGADIIELGVPYSDPLADGPTIQASATRALASGTTLQQVIDLVARLTPTVKAPIVLFTYYNPIYQRGFERFVSEIAAAGAKGLLVPDIPLEETKELSKICTKKGIDLVLLSTPTTPIDRMAKIADASNGFIYLVSVTGVTGARSGVESRVEELVKKLKTVTDKPVCVGFGISEEAQARQVVQWGADGVIVGSALVKALGESGSPEKGLEALQKLAVELRRGSNRDGAKEVGASGGGFFANLFGKK